MVSLIPSELGLTIYSEFFPCIAAAAVDKCAARAAAAAEPMEAPVRFETEVDEVEVGADDDDDDADNEEELVLPEVALSFSENPACWASSGSSISELSSPP